MTILDLNVRAWLSGVDKDFVYEMSYYGCFIVIWLIVILVCLIVKTNRPILGTILRGLKGNTVPRFLIGLLMGFGFNALCVLAAVLHGDISVSYRGIASNDILYIVILALVIIIQCGSEEILYRGYFYQRLRKGYKSPLFAILINPIAFLSGHLFNPGVTALALFNIYLTGVIISMMVYYFDSLWIAIAFHAGWNFTQNIIFGLPVSGVILKYSVGKMDLINGEDSFFYSVKFGVEGTWFFLVVIIILISLFYYFGRKMKVSPTDIWK